MKIKQVKLAQTIRGESSTLLLSENFDLSFDKGILHVTKKKKSDKAFGSFMVFPANIAWIEYDETKEALETVENTLSETASSEVLADGAKNKPGRPRKA